MPYLEVQLAFQCGQLRKLKSLSDLPSETHWEWFSDTNPSPRNFTGPGWPKGSHSQVGCNMGTDNCLDTHTARHLHTAARNLHATEMDMQEEKAAFTLVSGRYQSSPWACTLQTGEQLPCSPCLHSALSGWLGWEDIHCSHCMIWEAHLTGKNHKGFLTPWADGLTLLHPS